MSKKLINMSPTDDIALPADISDAVPYALGALDPDTKILESGAIRSVTLNDSSAITPEGGTTYIPVEVKLLLGSDASHSSDALLWVDASATTYDGSLEPGGDYDIVADDGFAKIAKGKRCLFSFTRITGNTILVNVKEYKGVSA